MEAPAFSPLGIILFKKPLFCLVLHAAKGQEDLNLRLLQP